MKRLLAISLVLCACLLALTPCSHDYSTLKFDEENHWYECDCGCDVKANIEQHTLEDSGWCSVCKQAVLPTNDINYEVSDDGTYAQVITYFGSSKKINIASTYNGVPVTRIRGHAFRNRGTITSIIIPDSVTSIGDSAFRNCASLTSINIPDNVTSIDCATFYNCSSLTSIIIPDSVTSIGDSAFRNCASLTDVVMGDGVKSIGHYAFEDCSFFMNIKYRGTQEQWSKIYTGANWIYNTNWHFNTTLYLTFNYNDD